MALTINPIKFGTDGWRGVIGADFTMERVAKLAPLAAQVLKDYNSASNLVIVGYDRRFMAEDFAQVTTEALQEAGFDVLLSESYAPTPAFSWTAKAENALGALVLTASHNPSTYLGLKVKGAFGGSVSQEVTKKIESLLNSSIPVSASKGRLKLFNPWQSYGGQLRSQVDIHGIKEAIASGKLKVFADVMHGAASGGLSQILGCEVPEINANRDPLFGGNPPEPLARYIPELFRTIKETARQYPQSLRLGFVFDGDGDRLAAVDGNGDFQSSQVLIPILIEHLASRRGLWGEVVKTLSGSDLIPKIAQLYHLPLFETAIGYKYIAERMLTSNVLIGGEESGGVGYGTHIPERDALLSALFVLEAVVESGKDITELYSNLQKKVDFESSYNRLDLPLQNMQQRSLLWQELAHNPLKTIAGKSVTDCLTMDGYKFRIEDGSWLLIRFSGTEPLLRLYSEAYTDKAVQQNLTWAKEWALSVKS
jgi:phosphomannomutase